MSQAWVLLWLPLGAPTPGQQALVDGWAQHERLSVRASQPTALPAQRPYPSEIVTHIEASLEAARLALDAGDPSGAIAHVVDAEKSLTDHPELPQAAWLMAENHRLSAAVARAQGDEVREREMLRAARVLEGPRATALDGVAPTETAPIDASKTMTLLGPRPGDRVEWDGVALEPRGGVWSVANTFGLHHVRVLRDSRLLWAGWQGAASDATSIDLPLPSPAACSTEDLAAARSPETLSSVRCESWVRARPTSGNAIELARCRFGVCEPFVRWPQKAPALALSQPTQKPDDTSSAATTYWGLGFLGVAIAATATALIWSATQSDDSERTVWVYDGIR